MSKITINAELREIGNKGALKEARRANKLPVVLYGFELANMNAWVDAREMEKVFAKAGMSSLVEVKVGEQEPVKVIIKEVQFDPVTDKLVHLDLYKVDLKKAVDVEVHIILTGVAPAVKALGGVLIHGLNSIHIRCLPEDLLSEIKVDLSELVEINDAIHVASLKLPENIELLTDPEQVIVSVKPPRVEVEVVPEEVVEETTEQEGAEKSDDAKGEAEQTDKTEDKKE
ncbi:MAG: 50S ribosomal protein L25 [Candidatus Komeilibacteria bacterium]